MVLFEDETDLSLFPPLRACWARRGDDAEVPLARRDAKRVIFGALNTSNGARLVGRELFTCREYCRLGRVRAQKKASVRGNHASWFISHDELLPFQRERLLPDGRRQPNTASIA